MRSCLWRLGRLGHAVRWLLLAAGLVFFLLTLSSYLKEPSTQPSRYQGMPNVKGKSSELLQKAPSLAPKVERWTTTHAGSARGNSMLDTCPDATGHTKARVPSTARTAMPRAQERKDPTLDTLSQGSRDRGAASNGTEAPSLHSQGSRTTKGRRDKGAASNGTEAPSLHSQGSRTTKGRRDKGAASNGTEAPSLHSQGSRTTKGRRDKGAASNGTEAPSLHSQGARTTKGRRDKGAASNGTEAPSLHSQGSRTTKGRRDKGAASNGTEAPSLHSQGSRTTKGRRDRVEKPTATRTAPAEPSASIARTPTPESRAEVLTTLGAGQPGGKTTGVATATVPPTRPARAARSSAPSPSPTTQPAPSLRAANFKSEPKWDFEEKYSLDVGGLQTSCPDSLKLRASKSLWLRNLFLPNLTLFLDSRHFNQSEWDRLEHFAPPFGFMELNHSLVQNVVTRFPPVAQQQLLLAGLPAGSTQCVSCAVVGNGGILNNSRMGREIDSHGHVFRLSGAVIRGYEQDVGTRTSFYGFTAFSLTQSLYKLGSQGFRHAPLGKDIRYLHFLEGTRDYEWLEALLLNQTLSKRSLFWFRHRPQVAFRGALQLDRYLLLHPDALRYMKNRFLRSKTLDTAHWRIYRPTTGALLLLTALQLCDKVSAYGFITEGHQRFSDHYYDKSWKKTVFYINHDFNLERKLWKRLHDEGIIRLYQHR